MVTATSIPAGEHEWVPPDTFGRRLRALRDQLGETPEELAPRCGLKPSTWRNWEHGQRPRDKAAVVDAVHRATGANRQWLMWGYAAVSYDADGPLGQYRAKSFVSIEDLDPRVELAFVDRPALRLTSQPA